MSRMHRVEVKIIFHFTITIRQHYNNIIEFRYNHVYDLELKSRFKLTFVITRRLNVENLRQQWFNLKNWFLFTVNTPNRKNVHCIISKTCDARDVP